MSVVLEDKIAVTTTATCRPDILARTYQSFCDNTGLDFKRMRLFINVDLVPVNISYAEIIKVAHAFFGEVVSNISDVPNFAASVKWLWSSVDSEYVFHLEDDWLLLEKVPMILLWDVLRDNPHIMQARFCGYHVGNVLRRISLGPGLIRGEICRKIGAGLKTDRNPEVQLKTLKQFGIERLNKTIAMVVPRNTRVIKDIGRSWASQHGIKHPKKERFVVWKTH